MQVLEFVEAMINKFPAEAVDSRFAVFFVPLAQRLQPEVSPACRRHLDGTISALLQRCTAGSRGVAVEWCCQWLKSEDGRMRTVSAQVQPSSDRNALFTVNALITVEALLTVNAMNRTLPHHICSCGM